MREVRQKSCVGRVDEGAQHEETVQNKKDPKDFVQEDKDDVMCGNCVFRINLG